MTIRMFLLMGLALVVGCDAEGELEEPSPYIYDEPDEPDAALEPESLALAISEALGLVSSVDAAPW